MNKILLHFFTCCMLIHLVGTDVSRCFDPQGKSPLHGLGQVNSLEDESEMQSFEIQHTDFSLHPVIKTVFYYREVSLPYSKCPPICATLSIFSPPPDFS